MKKILLILPLILGVLQTSIAQIKWADYSQSYPNGATNNKTAVALITAVRSENDAFWITNSNESIKNVLSLDTAFQNFRPKEFVTVSAFDTAKAQFFLHGVNRQNAGDYEFRVLENLTKTIVPWSKITRFSDPALQKSSVLPEMAYLGGYSVPLGNKVIVDIRKKGSDIIIGSSVVAWQSIKPVLLDIYTANELNLFLTRLSRPWSVRESRWSKQYPAGQLDPLTQLPKKLSFQSTDNNLVFYLRADIYSRKQIEYEVIKDGKVYKKWQQNDFDNCFIWLKNLPPGQYKLKFRYAMQRQNVSEYQFQLKTPWYQTVVFKIIGGSLIAAFFGFIVFAVLLVRQKQKAGKELAKKTGLQLELKSIHAQLNPHFVFNALSSIQGLVNKKDLAGANNYLSVFGQLMRNSLVNSGRDQVTLNEECKTLETYLKLEQLRFGFGYEISVNKGIDIFATEIPSLLLQPLIENAIKHGISGLHEIGKITLDFDKISNDMVVIIKDNGNGFDLAANTNGYGLKLTKDRIKLLNQMIKDRVIQLEILTSPGNPTTVALTFKNWFDEN